MTIVAHSDSGMCDTYCGTVSCVPRQKTKYCLTHTAKSANGRRAENERHNRTSKAAFGNYFEAKKESKKRRLFAPQRSISSLGHNLDVLDKAKNRASKRTPDKHNDAG
jgi:hypothetical protein